MKQDNQKPRYSTVHYGVRQQLGLTWAEYILLDMVYHLSAKYGYCNMSRGALAENLGISRMGLHKIISRLTDRELLVQESRGLLCAAAYLDVAYLTDDDVNKVYTGKQSLQSQRKQSLPSVNKVAPASTKFTNNRGDNNNINTLELHSKSKDLGADAPGKPEINIVMDYWTETVGYKIESRVKQNRFAASNMLKKHGLDKLKQLITGVALAHNDQYAPRISDLAQLQQKMSDLVVWGRQQQRTAQATTKPLRFGGKT